MREHKELQTLSRRSLFGKDTDKRFRLFKDLRTLLFPIEPSFLGKLLNMTIIS